MARVKTRDEVEKNISGVIIKQLRLRLGITQEQLGARMQVRGILWDQKIVSSVELQQRAIYDYELKALANILNTSVDILVEADNKEKI